MKTDILVEKKLEATAEIEEKPRLISFALFAYNQERFIREAVESALAQTYSPLEILLSDDCSSDMTFEIMKEIAKTYNGPHKIILNRNEQNLGIGGHVNKMYELSCGELIVLAAGDDIFHYDRVKVIHQEWKNTGFKRISIYSAVVPIDENGREIMTTHDHSNKCLGHVYSLNEAISNDSCYVIGASQAVAKELFEKFPPFDKQIFREDNVLPFRALLCDGIHFIEQPLVRYRHHANNVVSRISTAPRSSSGIQQRILSLIKDYEDKYWTRLQWLKDARYIQSQKMTASLYSDLERLIELKDYQLKIIKNNFVISLWYVLCLCFKIRQFRGIGIFMYKYFGIHSGMNVSQKIKF